MHSSDLSGTDPIGRVHEGMHVVDSSGKDIGRVESVSMGDPQAATTAGNEERGRPGALGAVADAFGSEREPDVPEPLRSRLVREGYIKVDAENRCGDGLWMSTPQAEVVDAFERAGGKGPVFGQISLCYAKDEQIGRKIGHRYWRTAGVPGQLSQDLPTVSHFETASSTVTEDEISEHFPCGPRLEPIVERAQAAVAAGVDHLYIHQIGPDQDGFLEFWNASLRRELEAVGLTRSS